MLWSGPHGGVLTLLKAVLCLKMPEKRGSYLLIQPLDLAGIRPSQIPAPLDLFFLEPPKLRSAPGCFSLDGRLGDIRGGQGRCLVEGSKRKFQP